MVDQVELRQFPFIMAYSHNTTLAGNLCYAIDLMQFESDCYMEDDEDKRWIVISPFDYVNTNDLLSNAPAFNIDGVII